MKPEAEKIRIRYLYRRMILSGEIKVSHRTAKRMVGPDCAYHLYGTHAQLKSKVQRKSRERERNKR